MASIPCARAGAVRQCHRYRAASGAQALTVSGGVSEYVFEHEETDFCDLGLPFARTIRHALNRQTFGLPAIIAPNLGISATAVGASQFNVQDGINAYLSDEAVADSIRDALSRADLTDGEQPISLTFTLPGSDTHEALLRTLAEGIGDALPGTTSRGLPLVLVVNQGDMDGFVQPD